MTKVYIAENADKDKFLKSVLLRHTAAPFEILREKNGKPYINGNPVYFNITTSGSFCAAAVSGRPVGVDMEVYGRGIREAVKDSFCKSEQAEIITEKDFLTHWTAREAHIKLLGGTLAHMLKDIAFQGGILSCNGTPAEIQPQFFYSDKFVLAICGYGDFDIIYT